MHTSISIKNGGCQLILESQYEIALVFKKNI